MTCTASGQVVTCTGTPAIAAGGSLVISYSTSIAASASGKLVNAVLLTALGGDPRTPANDAADPASGAATQGSDKLSAKAAQTVSAGTLTVSKELTGVSRGGSALGSLTGYQVRSGDVLTYTVSVVESGGTSSSTTTLTETVPSNTSYSGSGEGWTLASGNYTQSVTVGAGATVTKTFTVTVGTLSDGVTAITNTVTASTGSCTSCTVSSATAPRLAISKAVPASLPAGGSATWSVTITNNGGSATSGTLTFTDTLPAGLTFVSQTAGSMTCTASGQVVTCTGTPAIAAGGSLVISYSTSIAASASGKLVNAVLLTALGGDPRTPANDAADPASGAATQGSDKLSAKAAQTVSAAVATNGSVTITKRLRSINGTLGATTIASGDTLVYEIAIRETTGKGPVGTVLTETVPAHTSYTGVNEGWVQLGAQYNQAVAVDAGQTAILTFTVKTGDLGEAVDSIRNTVTASNGDCLACTVSNPTAVITQSQSQGGKVKTGGSFTTVPVAGCTSSAPTIVEAPKHGQVRIDASGTVTYLPQDSYFGTDSFSYSLQCSVTKKVIVNVNLLVIDPSGIVYDAHKRTAVSGAVVTLLQPDGSPLPDDYLDLVNGGRNGQKTEADGRYALLLKANAPSGTYQLRVKAPSGYRDAPATSIPPKSSLYTPGLGGGIEYIQKQDRAPDPGEDTSYYLAFAFKLGSNTLSELSNAVAHNHIPLDPVQPALPLVVTKTAGKRSVVPGDLVPYRITVRTQDGVERSPVNVVDILPAGFRFVSGSATVNGAPVTAQVNGGTVVWPDQTIPPQGVKTYGLMLSVGAGTMQGNRTNVALARALDGTLISNRAEAVVTIGPDRLFDCTDVIGKVFEDRNRDGKQGDDEKGIANARVATVNGLLVTTDAQGRFHIACAALPNALIGSNFVLKLDPASLPGGMEVLSENPSSARLTAGLMNRMNFAVAARSNYEAAFSPTDFTVDGTLRQERFEALVRQANAAAQARRILRLRYAAGASEDIGIARQWLDKVIMDLRRAVPALDALDSDIVQPAKRGVER